MVCYGTESGNYSFSLIDDGNATSYTINDLDENEPYYFQLLHMVIIKMKKIIFLRRFLLLISLTELLKILCVNPGCPVKCLGCLSSVLEVL